MLQKDGIKMKDKFNAVKNEIAQKAESFSTRKLAVGGLSALAIASAMPEKANAVPFDFNDLNVRVQYLFNYRGYLNQVTHTATSEQESSIDMRLYNDGHLTCDLDISKTEGVLQDSKMTMSIDKAERGKWVRDTRFKTRSADVKADENSKNASGSIDTFYNVRSLARENQNNKLRLNCESQYRGINNRILLPKGLLEAYAKVYIGNNTTNN